MLMTAKGTRKYNALYKTASEVVRNIKKRDTKSVWGMTGNHISTLEHLENVCTAI